MSSNSFVDSCGNHSIDPLIAATPNRPDGGGGELMAANTTDEAEAAAAAADAATAYDQASTALRLAKSTECAPPPGIISTTTTTTTYPSNAVMAMPQHHLPNNNGDADPLNFDENPPPPTTTMTTNNAVSAMPPPINKPPEEEPQHGHQSPHHPPAAVVGLEEMTTFPHQKQRHHHHHHSNLRQSKEGLFVLDHHHHHHQQLTLDAARASQDAMSKAAPKKPPSQTQPPPPSNKLLPPLISKHDEKWNAMYQKLVAFARAHGNTRVPQLYEADPPLGRWVKRQRFEYTLYCRGTNPIHHHHDAKQPMKSGTTTLKQQFARNQSTPHSASRATSKITPSRIQKLNEIHFEWDPGQADWEKMFERLRRFYETNGHSHVPKGYRHDKELANFVRNQRLEGNKQKLSEHRIQQLNTLNFMWKRNKTTTTSVKRQRGGEPRDDAARVKLQKR